MRATGVFFLYLVVCLILGALIAYPLLQTGWITHDPHRIMSRSTQVFILVGLWPLLAFMGLANRWVLGFGATRSELLRGLWLGWLQGLVILFVLALSLLLLGVRVPDAPEGRWVSDLLTRSITVLTGGFITSLLEETFFRGALYSAIRRANKPTTGPLRTILWSSLLFALLHFIKPHPLPDGLTFDWTGAWRMFLQVFTGAFHPEHLDSLAALFLAGIFLAQLRHRTGHIGWCIGIHAGWIFVIGMTRYLTDGNDASPCSWLVGDYDGIIGWLAAFWIALVILGFSRFTGSTKPPPTHGLPTRRCTRASVRKSS